MSRYLIFKKGNTELCSYVGSSKIYEALSGYAKPDEWSEVSEKALMWGEENLQEKKEFFSSQIAKYKEALNYLKEAEDIYEAIDNIKEVEEELKEIDEALGDLKFLKNIRNHLQQDNENGEKIPPLEWKLDF